MRLARCLRVMAPMGNGQPLLACRFEERRAAPWLACSACGSSGEARRNLSALPLVVCIVAYRGVWHDDQVPCDDGECVCYAHDRSLSLGL